MLFCHGKRIIETLKVLTVESYCQNIEHFFRDLRESYSGDFFMEFVLPMAGLSPALVQRRSYAPRSGTSSVTAGYRAQWGSCASWLQKPGHESPVASRYSAMRRENQKGQNLIEYALIVAVVVSAMFAMSIYVYRSVQATQQAIQEEAAK